MNSVNAARIKAGGEVVALPIRDLLQGNSGGRDALTVVREHVSTRARQWNSGRGMQTTTKNGFLRHRETYFRICRRCGEEFRQRRLRSLTGRVGDYCCVLAAVNRPPATPK